MTQGTVSFKATTAEHRLIAAIADRYIQGAANFGIKVDKLELRMDITACHANGCPLNLQKLLDADEFNLAHDVGGIHRHLDRNTGKLTNCFLPRAHALSAEAV